jgi:Fur family ferric uptake transcriptional regulator
MTAPITKHHATGYQAAKDAATVISRLEQLCIDKGMRMTDQRRVIARVLSDAEDHPDVEEVYRRASVVDNRISIATVYRTVRLLEDAGILERHDFRAGRSRYEQVSEEHHDHLIDLQTGDVVEFRNEQIERLQELIARELGFRLVDHRLELYGVPLKDDER